MNLVKMKARLTPIAAIVQANIGDAFNLDALANLFLKVEDLDRITPAIEQTLDYAKFIPVTPVNAVYGGGEVLIQKVGVGKGRDHTGTGKDIPLAEVVYGQIVLPVKLGSIGYRYSLAELEAATAAGLTLESDKVDAARLAAELHLADVAWYGYKSANKSTGEVTRVNGMVNQDGVTVVLSTNNWATATIEQIMTDVNNALSDASTAFDESGIAIQPDTFLLASTQYMHLSTRMVADSGGKTFLKYVEENNIFATQGKPITFRGSARPVGKGTGGVDRSIIYRRDASCITFKCNEVDFLAAQPDGLDVLVPGSYKYQGTFLKRVDSMRYLDHAA